MSSFGRRWWLLVPGAATVAFALAAIALPVGSDGLGATVSAEPGVAPSLGRWARDIHDGFWLRTAATAEPRHRRGEAPTGDRALAQELCYRGEAEAAVDLYRRLGVATYGDRTALWDLFETMVFDADYERCEWYAPEADRLLGWGTFQNNLAWYYTQTDQRARKALDLALSSVAEDRNACNVDTLAWAYWRNGQDELARRVAQETMAFRSPWLSRLASIEEERAKDSSRKLLGLIDGDVDSPHRTVFGVLPQDR